MDLRYDDSAMRNVIFDLGGVVLEWNPDAILESHYADAGVRAAVKSALFAHPDWLQLDRGTLTEAQAISRVAQRIGMANGELAELFEAARRSLRPKADSVALLDELAARGVPLYCLSNMPAATFAYLRDRYPFWKVFRGIVISGEIRMLKPDREIFEYILHRYSLPPASTVFIDDHAPNVQAAGALGLHAILFRDALQCRAELEPLLAGE